MSEVYSTIEILKAQFGDDFYLELQNNTLEEPNNLLTENFFH